MPEEDEDAAKSHEAQEVVGVALVAHDQPAVVAQPDEQPLYEVTVSIGRVKKVAQSRESRTPRCDVRGGHSGLGAVGLEQAQGMP